MRKILLHLCCLLCIWLSTQQETNWRVVNVSTSTSIIELEIGNNVQYNIVSCSSGSKIRMQGKGLSRATNWLISVALTEIDNINSIEIYATKGSNGTIEILLPSFLQQQYPIQITQNPDQVFGEISFGNINVKMDTSDIIIIRSISQVFLKVIGSPADLIVDVSDHSVLQLENAFNMSILVVNTTTFITDTFPQTTILITGNSSITYYNYSTIENATLFNGCFSSSRATFSTFSPFFLAAIQQYEIPIPSENLCSLIFHKSNQLFLTSSDKLTMSQPDGKISKINIQAIELFLTDSIPWKFIMLSSNTLEVVGRYSITGGGGGGNKSLTANLLSSMEIEPPTSTININCDGSNGNNPVKWIFGTEETNILEWESINLFFCFGVIKEDIFLGQVIFQYLNDDISVVQYIQTTSQSKNDQRKIEISQQNSVVNMKNDSSNLYNLLHSNISWEVNESIGFNYQLVLVDGGNIIQIYSNDNDSSNQSTLKKILPILQINYNASASVNLPGYQQSSISFLNQVKFIAENKIISAGNKMGNRQRNEQFCFESYFCNDEEWIAAAAHGSNRCQSQHDNQVCQSNAKIIIDTQQDGFCSTNTEDENGFSIFFKKINAENNRNYKESQTRIKNNIFGDNNSSNTNLNNGYWSEIITETSICKILFLVVFLLLGIFSLILWARFGFIIYTGNYAFLFLNSITKIHEQEPWSLSAKMFIDSMNEAITNLHTGWNCGQNGIQGDSTPDTFLASIIVFVLSIFLLCLRKKQKFIDFLGRYLIGTVAFIFLPFLTTHPPDISFLFIGIILLLFVLLCWEIPEKGKLRNVFIGVSLVIQIGSIGYLNRPDSELDSNAQFAVLITSLVFHIVSNLFSFGNFSINPFVVYFSATFAILGQIIALVFLVLVNYEDDDLLFTLLLGFWFSFSIISQFCLVVLLFQNKEKRLRSSSIMTEPFLTEDQRENTSS